MVKLSMRSWVHTCLAVLALFQLLILADIALGAGYLGDVATWLSAAIALGLLASWVFIRRFAPGASEILTQRDQLMQESAALNSHALVLRTNNDAKVTFVNEKFLKVTGFDRESLIGKSVDQLYFPEDLQLRRKLKAIIDAGGNWEGESRLRRKDGREVWTNLTIFPGIDSRGEKCGSISVRTDITETKTMMAEQELFRTLNRLSDEVFIFDLASTRLKYANRAAARSHGLQHTTYLDFGLSEIHPLYSSDRFEAGIERLRTGEEELVVFDTERNGHIYEVRLQILDKVSSQDDVIATLHDITHRVEAEKVRDEFISTVSHELRSPMTSIKGALGLLLAGSAGELPDRAQNVLNIAHRNADRLIHIINDLLDIEKIAAGKMKFDAGPYEVSALIDEALLANENFSRRFDVTFERDGEAGGVAWFDFDRSLQVLNNLISNATKFSRPGGKVIVRVTDHDKGIDVSVQDFGKGIPKAMQDKVFEKFVQVDRASEGPVRGTGLGLAIVKAICEQQGGGVRFDSVEGEGSTFTVTFPKPGNQKQEDQEDMRRGCA